MGDRITGASNADPLRTTRPGTREGNVPVLTQLELHVAQDRARISSTAVHLDPHAALLAYPAQPVDHAKGPETHVVDDPHHEPDKIDDLAHTAHNPHGAMHAVEAVEVAGQAGARVIGRLTRGAAIAAEVSHDGARGHHGVLGKLEKLIDRGFKWTGRLLGRGVRAVPGGGRALDGLKRGLGYPGRLLGPGLDAALVGTRASNTLRMTGSAGRFFGTLGGRIPVIGAVFGGIIAVADYRATMKVLRDPKASGGQMAIAGTQGLLSVTSGAVGVAALATAGLAAIGLITAPAWIVPAMGIAAIAGAGAFVLTFFKKSSH